MKDMLAMIAILAALIAYSSLNAGTEKQDYSVPQNYRGKEGLDYIRKNYASQLSQAQGLCTGRFKGTWMDNSNTIGCFNMQGFSSVYCSLDIICQLTSMCNSIGGSAVCSSVQARCSI